MIVETTNYFAREGRLANVLGQRFVATEIRRQLRLEPGRIMTLLDGPGPDVRWECTFASREAFDADMAARNGSAEFNAAREAMHALLERFERSVFEIAT